MGALQLLRRLGMAVRPVADILRRTAPWSALAILLAQLLSGLAMAGSLLLTNAVLAQLIGHAPSAAQLRSAWPILAALCGMYLLRLGLEAATAVAKAKLGPKVHRAAEERLLEVSLQVKLAAFDEADFYDRLHRARDRGVLHMENATTCLVEVLSATLAVAGAALALALLHPLLLLLLALALLPEGWAVLKTAGLQFAAMPITIELTRQAQLIGELATEREAAPEIRATQAQRYVLEEYRRSAAALEQHLVRQGLAEARAASFGRLFSAAGLLAVFVALIGMLTAGWLDLAVAGTAVIAIRSAGAALTRLMQVARELFEKALYIGDFRDFVERAARDVATGSNGTRAAPAQPGQIELEQVSFGYAGAPRPALREVSLSIQPGQTVALVGENGSGKTTLAKLIAGLYQPSGGRIAWDGVDLREMTPESLADRVAMVLQEPVRWPRSARDNIRLGRHDRPDPDEQLLHRAAAEAGADEVIDRLPQRWDTFLSRQFHGGQDLSGGQWQRLAVARGLYRDAPLVIWDEPTSALDAKAEYAVYESLRLLARRRTVILITHRLASIRHADRIYFLERGELVEQGTHDELVAAGGRYAELYRLQDKLHGNG